MLKTTDNSESFDDYSQVQFGYQSCEYLVKQRRILAITHNALC